MVKQFLIMLSIDFMDEDSIK